MSADSAAVVVAILALFVSIYAAVKTNRAAERENRIAEAQADMQVRLLQIEAAREQDRVADRRAAEDALRMARLAADIVETNGRVLLRIRNEGPGDARDVAFTIDGLPLPEHTEFADAGELPTDLRSGREWFFRKVRYDGMVNRHRIDLTWHDATGMHEITFETV